VELSGWTFTSAEAYRYSFQDQEKDKEFWGGAVSYKYRVEDPRLGRFFSVDPLAPKYAYNSPYAFSENRVLASVELEGLERIASEIADNMATGALLSKNMTREQVANIVEDVLIIGTGVALVIVSGGMATPAVAYLFQIGIATSEVGAVKLVLDIKGDTELSGRIPESYNQLIGAVADGVAGNKKQEYQSSVEVAEDAIDLMVKPEGLPYTLKEMLDLSKEGFLFIKSSNEKWDIFHDGMPANLQKVGNITFDSNKAIKKDGYLEVKDVNSGIDYKVIRNYLDGSYQFYTED
jgi:RHS repeat-associated protein